MDAEAPTPDETIADASGCHELATRWVPQGDGHDFAALVWRTREGTSWKDTAVITREQFQAGSNRRRWISALHSFDPATGHAIIKVAEGDTPIGARKTHFVYSWREWSIPENRELRYLHTCERPFDDLPPNKA
jgi:hypothetical protein